MTRCNTFSIFGGLDKQEVVDTMEDPNFIYLKQRKLVFALVGFLLALDSLEKWGN